MNIGIATDTYLPRINGVVRSILTFAGEFRRLGHRVFIFAPAFREFREPEEDVWRFPSSVARNNPEDRLVNLFRPKSLQLFRRLGGLKLDVLHTHTPFTLGIATLAWARRKKIPTVHTYHTLFETYVEHYAKSMPKRMGRFIVHRASRTFCNRHQVVVAPSRAMAKVLRTYGVKVPIKVIPTGVDLAEFSGLDSQRMRKKLGLARQDKLLLTMGRVAGEKNISFLFDVMERLGSRQPRARLIIAGEGPGMKTLQQECARRKLGHRVAFIGYVKGRDRVDLFAAADLHISASLTETQGLVLSEAMAAGTPCVAVAAMGVRDVLARGGGILVPPRSEAFTNAVDRLLRDKALYLQKAREAKAQASFWSAAGKAHELISVYRELVK